MSNRLNRFIDPEQAQWPSLVERPVNDPTLLWSNVSSLLTRVQQEGDSAVRSLTAQFDGCLLDALELTQLDIEAACAQVPADLKDAIQQAIENIERFHAAQMHEEQPIETMPGVSCWRKWLPIEKVGIYIPGGTAPLFSTVLMLAIPARIAGCKEVVLCSPPNKQGDLAPAMVYAAVQCGVQRMFRVGGVQAIGAMAYGTESIPKVDKIFGPGNQYVTAAKQLVAQRGVAIDMPAGPSEVAVFADETAIPAFVAADLLSQAEHGIDSQVLLVATQESIVDAVEKELDKQLAVLPRQAIAEAALVNSRAVVLADTEAAFALLNAYAAEHLIIASDRALEWASLVTQAGSVFLGHFAPESVGDYASGTNHTLPTNGYARAYSGVSVDSFVRKVTFQQLSPAGLQAIGTAVETMAAAEGLDAHRLAVTIRKQFLNQA